MQRVRTPVPRHLSSHSALSSYGPFAPLALWRLSVSVRPMVARPMGVARLLEFNGFPPCPHSSKGSGNNNNYQCGLVNESKQHAF